MSAQSGHAARQLYIGDPVIDVLNAYAPGLQEDAHPVALVSGQAARGDPAMHPVWVDPKWWVHFAPGHSIEHEAIGIIFESRGLLLSFKCSIGAICGYSLQPLYDFIDGLGRVVVEPLVLMAMHMN